MKTLPKILAGVVVLAVVAWSAPALYWHFRIGRAIRTLEKTDYFSHSTCSYTTSPSERAAQELLNEAGVRALPALVRSLNPEKRAPYLTEASVLVRRIVLRASNEDLKERLIGIEASPSERALKCRLLREWWSERGHEVSRPWRPWDRGYCSVR